MVAIYFQCQVCRYRSIEEEFSSPVVSEVQRYFTDEDCRSASIAMNFMVHVFACLFLLLKKMMYMFQINVNTFIICATAVMP